MALQPPVEHVLHRGELSAAVLEQGATLRQITLGDVALLDGFGPGQASSGGRGQVLAPFPNRLEDGAYRFGDREGAVAWNEPERHNAIHGLVRWRAFETVEIADDRVRLAALLVPSPDYPFLLRLELDYRLLDAGVEVTFSAENLDEVAAPFGIGFHPYLAAGAGGVDGCRLEVPATTRLVLDGRGLPEGRTALAGTDYARLTDASAPIGALVLDDCLTGLGRGPDGRVLARVERGDGHVLTLRADTAFNYLMCFSGDTLEPVRRRTGLALEPMTCPPNALRSGDDLIALAPGESAGASFAIELVA